MHLKLGRLRADMVPIIKELLGDKALEEGEEYGYILIYPIEHEEPVQHSMCRKSYAPAVATFMKNLKNHSTAELKWTLSIIFHEMENRKVPLRDPSKRSDVTLAQGHEISSILHNLI